MQNYGKRRRRRRRSIYYSLSFFHHSCSLEEEKLKKKTKTISCWNKKDEDNDKTIFHNTHNNNINAREAKSNRRKKEWVLFSTSPNVMYTIWRRRRNSNQRDILTITILYAAAKIREHRQFFVVYYFRAGLFTIEPVNLNWYVNMKKNNTHILSLTEAQIVMFSCFKTTQERCFFH